jgi:hypothetical protein
MHFCTECGDAQDLDQNLVQYLTCYRCSKLEPFCSACSAHAHEALSMPGVVVGQF